MARKLTGSLMKENVIGNTLNSNWCAWCKKREKQLCRYWDEPIIGGYDCAPKHTLPFCSIGCYRKYYGEKK